MCVEKDDFRCGRWWIQRRNEQIGEIRVRLEKNQISSEERGRLLREIQSLEERREAEAHDGAD